MAGSDGTSATASRRRATDRSTIDALFASRYDDLKRIACSQLRGGEPGGDLSATVIVNEAYLRLAARGRVRFNDADHFLCLAARVMRQIVVDSARRRVAKKRGGGRWATVLEEERCGESISLESSFEARDVLRLFSRREPTLARVARLRYLEGISVDDTARALGISRRTVVRDGRRSRELLRQAFGGADAASRRC